MDDRLKRMSCLPRLFVGEFCQLCEKKVEKVERKRKTDRDLYVVEVVEVDTTRKQLKIHFVGFSHEYDGWRDYDNKYLLLAEFSVRTVNYGPSFFPSIYGPRASRLGHKSMEKNSVRNLQYGPKTRLIRCLSYGFFLFGGPETSAGRTI